MTDTIPIYLDYAATTPIDSRVLEIMWKWMSGDFGFGNPASPHQYGQQAKKAIEFAREEIANCIEASADEIIFTSGATESNNLALKGASQLYQARGRHIITLATEHKSVLDSCHALMQQGFSVTFLKPRQCDGILDPKELIDAIRPDTILVSILAVNNETGVIQNLKTLGDIIKQHHILFHVDATQAIGKLDFSVQAIPVDLASMTAHKVYGPKGIGALYVRKKPRVRLAPLIHGGGHEVGMRSGTLPTHQIVGMGKAFSLAKTEWKTDRDRIEQLRLLFLSKLKSIPFQNNISTEQVVPHILNLYFENQRAQDFLSACPEIGVSTSSACQSLENQGSHVLRALGYEKNRIDQTLRISLGRMTTESQILQAVRKMEQAWKP